MTERFHLAQADVARMRAFPAALARAPSTAFADGSPVVVRRGRRLG